MGQAVQFRRSDSDNNVLAEMRSINELCDVAVIVEEKRFPAHKCVLAAASPVLRKLLTNGMRETKQREFALLEVKATTWGAVLDYIYYKPISITKLDFGLTLLECALRFEITMLETLIARSLAPLITEHNCCQLIADADAINSAALSGTAMKVLCAKFHLVCTSNSISLLSLDMMESVVSNRKLRLRSELDVIHGIVWWLIGNGYIEKRSVSANFPDVYFTGISGAKPQNILRCQLKRLTRSVSPEKMSTEDLKKAIPLCRAAGLSDLYDLCVDILVSEVNRAACITTRSFVHCRNKPDASFNITKAVQSTLELARSFENYDSCASAERFYEEVLFLNYELLGKDTNHKHIRKTLRSLGDIRRLSGDFANAKHNLDTYLRMCRTAKPAEEAKKELAIALYCQGQLAKERYAWPEANRYMNEFLKQHEECDYMLVAATRVLGRAALASNDLEAAEDLLRKSLKIGDQIGMTNMMSAISALDLVRVLIEKGELQQAQQVFHECVDGWNNLRETEVENWRIGQALHTKALLQYNQGKLEQAVNTLSETAEFYRRSIGMNETHPMLIEIVNNIGMWQDENS